MGKFIIENKGLRVRTLIDKDKIQLAKWLSDPEVLQYYEGRDNPFNVEKVAQEFFDDDDDVSRFLVELNEVPIGYVQCYVVGAEDRKFYGYPDSTEVIYGMDQFIGEVAYWNRGIGSQLVRSVLKYLIRKKDADRIVMDPQIQNKRAIRCYEKCGFKKVKLLPKRELHEGEYRDCWLIEYSEMG